MLGRLAALEVIQTIRHRIKERSSQLLLAATPIRRSPSRSSIRPR